MAQDCTPQALINAAGCFNCLTIQQLLWLRLYLLCTYANYASQGILGEKGEFILGEGGEFILEE